MIIWGRKTSKNNDLLSSVRKDTSPKIYSLLVDLVNDNREDLAEIKIKNRLFIRIYKHMYKS